MYIRFTNTICQHHLAGFSPICVFDTVVRYWAEVAVGGYFWVLVGGDCLFISQLLKPK